MSSHEHTTLETDLRIRSRYEVAREVHRGLHRIEIAAGKPFSLRSRRKASRHELFHHLPLEQSPVMVRTTYHWEDDGLHYAVGVGHDNASGCLSIISSLYPLLDRRVEHRLSSSDWHNIWLAFRRLWQK